VGDIFMSWGRIVTNQKCPICGERYPSSKGDSPITCCKTQPTKFLIQIYWQGKDVNISRDREGKTIHSFVHARIVLDIIRAEYKSFDPEIYHKQSSTQFKTFWLHFLKKYEGHIGTHSKLKSIGVNQILPTFGDMQLRDIRAYHIDQWWTELLGKGLAPRTLNDLRQWLLSFLTQAQRLDIIEKVPRFPDPVDVPIKHIAWISEEEQLKVLNALPEYDRPIFDFLFLTGCRVNEATGLQRTDTDWIKGLTIINHTIRRDGSLGGTKNKKPRVIPHFPELVECLKSKVVKLNSYQFVNKWGKRYSDDYLRDRFNEACETVGVEPIPLKNATRHSFGMGLLRKGFNIWQVSKAMNHSTIRMTEYYVEVLAEETKVMYGRGSRRNPAKMKNKAR